MSRPRALVVSGIRVRHDAISNIMCHQHRALTAAGWEVELVAHHDDGSGDGVRARTVPNAWVLLRDPAYLAADLVIFHFGIWYDLFNALTLPHPTGAVRVLHFHNVTPPELLAGETRRNAEAGLIQLGLASEVDVVWSDSPHNSEALVRFAEVDPASILTVPPALPDWGPPPPRPEATVGDPVRLVVVGRFAAAKGLDDLLDALAAAGPALTDAVRVVLAGSPANSDADYLEALRGRVRDDGLVGTVEIVTDPTDAELLELLCAADVFVSPSHHEGFCVPAAEALASGCRAVVTSAGALPDTVGDAAVVVAPRDPVALAAALADEVDQVLRCRAGEPAALAAEAARSERARRQVARFHPDAVAERVVAAAAEAIARRR